jgi:hypothetical protein
VSKPFKGITGPRKKPGGLLLPSHYRLHQEQPRFLCVVCYERGEPEAGEFYTEAEYLRHVNGTSTQPACADRHPEVLQRMSPALSAPGLFDENYEGSDLEWKRWLEEHAEALAEGRMNDKTSDGKRGG